MDLNFGKQFKGLKEITSKWIDKNPSLREALNGCELSMGLASEPSFGIPDHARQNAIFVGDSHLIGDLIGSTSELDVMFRKDPNSVQMTPKWNWKTGKYDMKVSKFVGDADQLIPGQLISPWNVSWFQGVFKKPLSYSRASDLVKTYTGTNPWASVMSLLLADYSGFSAFDNAGRPDNTISRDVSVQSGLMSSQIINLSVTYSLTTEEMERAKSESPFSGQLITQKQKYNDYVMDMLKSYLIYYGNSGTGTIGLFTVNSVTSFGGTSLTDIYNNGSDVTKGSTAYNMFAKLIRDFLTASDNKFNHLKVSMSPLAYNLLATLTYSNVYNPDSAIAIIKKNLETDMTKDGKQLKLDIISDPLLKQSSIFNAQVYDYLVIVATEIDAGPGEESQDIALFGEPISEFVYPVIPGSFHTQYRKLKRIGGVFCPVGQAVAVYSGFGIDA